MGKSRQQFEEWFNKNGISSGWCSKRDLEFIKNKMYQCWQASRESLEVELPDSIEYSKEYRECDYDEGYRKGYNFSILECKQILISNGVKIKND